jgi:hypothetical protein
MQITKKNAKLLNTVMLIFALSACNANSPAPADATVASATPAASQSVSRLSAATLPAASATQQSTDEAAESRTSINNVSKGMAYADFRQALLAQGWQPVTDPKCKANVVGGAYKELCAKGSDSCKACDELPELSACSGDADCVMNFHHADKTLQASTYGDIADRNVRGKDSQLNVTGWKVSETPDK